jgi:carboxypeptidase Taq
MTTEKTNSAYEELRERLATISDVGQATSLLFWDQQTHMPPGGVAGRAESVATLSRLAHEMLVAPETERLLEAAGDPDPESEEGALLRLARREYERATKLPAQLVAELSRTTSLAEPAWVEARERSDFAAFAPHLEKIVELKREAAEALGYEDHPYDALLDGFEPGAKKARLEALFGEIRSGLVPLVRGIIERGGDEDRATLLHGDFDEEAQDSFGRRVATDLGYDWKRGRQDRTVHPFCIGINVGDVRVTTRFDKEWLSPALFGTIHETGHALYEQGVKPEYARTPLAGGVSMGVHESQSRLWENLVARSRPFWSHYLPSLREAFPEALGGVELEGFYRAVNAVRPSEIRVEADEATYDLHVLLRFELEVALIERSLAVPDLPEAWNAKMEEYLSLTPRDDAHGVLQDIHWADGLFGYFPTYTIGNVLAAQLFEAVKEAHPEIPEEIGRGEFGPLLGWLRENVHRHGSRYEPEDLILRSTGRPLDTAPYLSYLREKFGELYGSWLVS